LIILLFYLSSNTQQQSVFGAAQSVPAESLFTFGGSPYGDSRLFRDLDLRAKKKEELCKPTSLAAQRAYAKPSSLKFKPCIEGVPSAPRPLSRRSLVISPQQVKEETLCVAIFL
jgi:hypothetical protein